ARRKRLGGTVGEDPPGHVAAEHLVELAQVRYARVGLLRVQLRVGGVEEALDRLAVRRLELEEREDLVQSRSLVVRRHEEEVLEDGLVAPAVGEVRDKLSIELDRPVRLPQLLAGLVQRERAELGVVLEHRLLRLPGLPELSLLRDQRRDD